MVFNSLGATNTCLPRTPTAVLCETQQEPGVLIISLHMYLNQCSSLVCVQCWGQEETHSGCCGQRPPDYSLPLLTCVWDSVSRQWWRKYSNLHSKKKYKHHRKSKSCILKRYQQKLTFSTFVSSKTMHHILEDYHTNLICKVTCNFNCSGGEQYRIPLWNVIEQE